jgi:ribonuclease BN (tRNA processing enzyme)
LSITHKKPRSATGRSKDVGRVAAEAGVKRWGCRITSRETIPTSDEMWVEGVWKHFKGRIIVGKDLLEI